MYRLGCGWKDVLDKRGECEERARIGARGFAGTRHARLDGDRQICGLGDLFA